MTAFRTLALLLLAACECQPRQPALVPPDLVVGEGKAEVEVLFAGDLHLARGMSTQITKRGKGDPRWVLEPIAERLRQADLTWLNLECVFSDSEDSQAKKRWVLRATPGHLDALPHAGVDVVSFANNHTHDFKEQGVVSTLAALEARKVLYTGIRRKGEAVQKPLIVQAGDTRVAFLAFNWKSFETKWAGWPRAWFYKREAAERAIAAAKRQADQVVVSVHWGWEYQMHPRPLELKEARALAAAGADVVVGHHPHVPGPVEEIGGTLVTYSLGNFVFDMRAPFKVTRTRRGYLLSVKFAGGKRTGFELVPMRLGDDYRPRVDPSVDVESWIRRRPETPYRLSEHVRQARVERVYDGKTKRCGKWRKKHPRGTHQYLYWLRPRWRCPDDRKRPWLTVAATGERSAGVYREGVWAHPHGEGPLVLTFPKVPAGAQLVGHAGSPDWGLKMAKRAAPVQLSVSLWDAGGREVGVGRTFDLPHRAGWVPLAVDTGAAAGQAVDVRVEIRSDDASRREFMFDLWVR